MFTDNNKKGGASSDLRSQPNRIEKETSINGSIVSKDDFRIEGKLEGSLTTTGKVVIGPSGSINGQVDCLNADIEGQFKGEIKVGELLNLQAKSSVEGKVQTAKLAIAPGAIFEAECSMKPKGVSNLNPNLKDDLSQEAS